MGQIHLHAPVLLFMAAFSRYETALEWAKRHAECHWGPIALISEPFPFTQTRYYEQTMGTDLHKCFIAFQRLIDPAELIAMKHQTNTWEQEYQKVSDWSESRPLNLDPGYLTEAKLILASTKDRDHRLYLGRGIYADQTLYFRRGIWQARDWTYPDYRCATYHAFFTRCRDYLRQQYRK